jgi:hypothetical protein
MRAYVWSYVVKPEWAAGFSAAYSANGEWAQFFAASPDYLGTVLLSPTDQQGRYLTIDCFNTPEARARLIDQRRDVYEQIDRRWADATLEETFLGEFRLDEWPR